MSNILSLESYNLYIAEGKTLRVFPLNPMSPRQNCDRPLEAPEEICDFGKFDASPLFFGTTAKVYNINPMSKVPEPKVSFDQTLPTCGQNGRLVKLSTSQDSFIRFDQDPDGKGVLRTNLAYSPSVRQRLKIVGKFPRTLKC